MMNKRLTLIIAALLISLSARAQFVDTTPPAYVPPPGEICAFVDQMPEPGFDVGQFLSKNIVYPKDAMMYNVSGRVVVKFIVDERGYVQEPRIVQSVFPSLDSTALSVVGKMPRWKPGYVKDKPVKVFYTIPIKFALSPGGPSQLPPVRGFPPRY